MKLYHKNYLVICLCILWDFFIPSVSAENRDQMKSSETGEECIDPAGHFGQCIPLQKCEHLFQFLREHPYNPQKIKFIQHATCQFQNDEPWVCCQMSEEKENKHQGPEKGNSNNNKDNGKVVPPSTTNYLNSSKSDEKNINTSQVQPSADVSPSKAKNPPVENEDEYLDKEDYDELEEQKGHQSSSIPISQNQNQKPGVEQEITNNNIVERHANFRLLPSLKSCGISLVTDRIVGGTAAGLGTYPWMALLSYKDSSDVKAFACGGTLINSRYVLTAAHCLAKLPGGFKVDFVRLGEYDQSKDPDCQDGLCAPKVLDIPVEETVIHEKYDETGRTEADIALIRLSKAVPLGPFTTPICLPRGNILSHNLEKSNLTFVAGFGRIRWNVERNSDVLQHVHVPVRTTTECNDFYSRQKIGKVDDSRFCAGSVKGQDSCQGDSGGPLMDSVYNEKLLQVQSFQFGIVSLGPSPCGSSNPALYSNVSHFMPWILEHIKA